MDHRVWFLLLLQLSGLLYASGRREVASQGLEDALAYELTDPAGKRHVLLGTLHARRPGDTQLSAEINALWDSVDALLVEINLDLLPRNEVFAAIQRYALWSGPGTLQEAIGEEAAARLGDLARDRGTLALIQGFRPWFVELFLAGLLLRESGLVQETGIDVLLIQAATRRGKKVLGLETIEEQFAALAAVPAEVQVRSLRRSLLEWDRQRQELVQLYENYQLGKVEDIARLFEAVRQAEPDFSREVVVRRNRRIAERLARVGAEHQSILVAVGLGHLLGPDSVGNILLTMGWKVVPLTF